MSAIVNHDPMQEQDTTPRQEREEIIARALAADAMGLVKDTLGTNLPRELWEQKINMARLVLSGLRAGVVIGTGRSRICSIEPAERSGDDTKDGTEK
jgi:hypothetical protein